MKRRGEEGLTLNELLIAMLITTIIVVPLAGVMYTSVHTMVSTQNRIDESNGASFLSSYFGPDVQNAVSIATGAGTVESSAACGATARAVDLLVTTTQMTISYYHDPSGPTAHVLYRRTCTGGVPALPVRLLRNLSGAPTFTCLDVNGLPLGACTLWQGLSGSVTQADAQNPGSSYTVRVQATKRVT
jgi:hypothetical protein